MKNKKDKIGVVVELYKADAKEFQLSDSNLNDARNIRYGKYRFLFLCECMYWYAIKVNGEYYAFDTHEIISLIGFEGSDQKDKVDWLLKFIECLESSEYYIDFENSIKLYSEPVGLASDRHSFIDLFFPILVTLIRRLHLNFDYRL